MKASLLTPRVFQWRELAAGEEARRGPLIVDGHAIPRDVQVGVSTYALHHNEAYFPEPFAFRPERWLVDDPGELRVLHAAFAAFSAGPRGCAGKAMAYLETSLVVAKTLWYFDFEPVPGDQVGAGVPGRTDGRERPGEFQLRDVYSAAHDGPNLMFHPRGKYCEVFETNKSLLQ
jgi:hypothetical protein